MNRFKKDIKTFFAFFTLIVGIIILIFLFGFLLYKKSLFLDIQYNFISIFLKTTIKEPANAIWILFFLDIYVSLIFIFISLYFFLSYTFFRKILFFLCCFFVCITIFLIIWNADWQFGDDKYFFKTICIKKPVSMEQLQEGRFCIGAFDFNVLLLTPFYNNPKAFYLIVALEYIIFSIFSFLICKFKYEYFSQKNKLSVVFLCLSYIFLHFLSHDMFFSLIYPEKLLLTLLSIFTYTILKAYRTKELKYWIISFVSAFFSTFCKEPMFGVFLVISLYILFFMAKGNLQAKYFSFFLLLDAVLFLLLYYYFSFKNTKYFYTGANKYLSEISLIKQIIKNQKIILILFLLTIFVVIKRIKQLLRHTFTPLIEDALLLSACAYAIAFYLLRFYAGYYFLPCFILAFPAFIHYGLKLYNNKKLLIQCISVFIFIIALLPYVYLYSWRCLNKAKYSHKNMYELQQIAILVNERNHFVWYDKGKLKDIEEWYKYTILPEYVNYINNNQAFFLSSIDSLPLNLQDSVFVISTKSIPEYENDSYIKLPIDLLNVYSINDNK